MVLKQLGVGCCVYLTQCQGLREEKWGGCCLLDIEFNFYMIKSWRLVTVFNVNILNATELYT